MNSLLHDLQNNEAILLMYLANELPAQDRAEVEHMLDRDDKLRLELAKIEEGYTAYHRTMRRMDAAMPPVSARAAARALGEAVRARQGDSISLDEHEEHRRRIHWMLYPIGAAAAVALGMFLWWQSARDDSYPRQGMPVMVLNTNPGEGDGIDPSFSGLGGDEDTSVADAQILGMFDPLVPNRASESQRQLAEIDYLDRSLQ